MREACEQIFPSSLFGKTDMRLRLRLLCVSERHCYRAWLQFSSNLSRATWSQHEKNDNDNDHASLPYRTYLDFTYTCARVRSYPYYVLY